MNIKKKIISLIALATSFYISFLFALGIIIGYLGTYFFDKNIRRKKLKDMIVEFNFGRWRIHFHHWLMGTTFLIIIWITGVSDNCPLICKGIAGGLILHDLYTDKNWRKVIIKKQKTKNKK